jgi:YD repeat-containing protein
MYHDSSLKEKNVFGPGIRVKKLNYYSNDVTKVLVKQYEYQDADDKNQSSGNLLFEPYMAHISNWGWDNEIDRIDLQSHTETGSLPYFSLWSNYYKSKFWSITDIPYITTERELRRKGKTPEQIIKKLISLSTHSMGPKSDIWGREIIYSNVTEKLVSNKNSDKYNGSKVYSIHVGDNRPVVNVASGPTDDFTFIEPAGLSSVGSWGSWGDTKVSYGYVDKKGTDIYPFPDRDYFNTKHGLLNGKTIRLTEKDTDGNIVRSTDYNYIKEGEKSYSSVIKGYLPTHVYAENDINQKLIIFNEPVKEYETYSGLYYFARNKYLIESSLLLKSKSVVTFDTMGGKYEENFVYSYDDYGQVNEITKQNSKGETIKTKVSYPADYRNDLIGFDPDDDISDPDTESTAIYYMLENNILNLPVERVEINETTGKIMAAEIIGYASRNKKIYPYSLKYLCAKDPIDYNSSFDLKITTSDPDYSYRVDYNENYQHQTTFNSYDDQLNLQQYEARNMPKTSILWGYNGLYPIVKAENVSIRQIERCLSSVELNTVKSGDSISDIEMRTILNKIRLALPNALVTTYTYKPLIGMTSKTEPNGITTFYEYDELGHLKNIKDADGKLIETNEYHYSNK